MCASIAGASPYATAVKGLADVDPASHSTDEFLDRLGAVLDEVPALADRRWELILAMESMLSTEERIPNASSALGKLIADVRVEQSLKAEARRSVLAEPMLTAEAVATALGSHSVNPRQYANAKRRKGVLLGLPVKNRYVFPAFQVDAERSTIVPGVAEVNALLIAAEDPWGVASWWFSVNGWLGRKRPVDCLGSAAGTEAVVTAARAEVAPIG